MVKNIENCSRFLFLSDYIYIFSWIFFIEQAKVGEDGLFATAILVRLHL